jgi:hypothetical protein
MRLSKWPVVAWQPCLMRLGCGSTHTVTARPMRGTSWERRGIARRSASHPIVRMASGPDRNAGAAAILRVLQDIAALTLACDLRDLRLAQRSGAHSPRLHGVATSARPPSGSWPTRSGAARLGADLGPRRLRRQSEPALVAAQSGSASSAALISEALRARMALWLILNMCA